MAKISLTDVTSGYKSTSVLNNNNTELEDALNNKVLYRDNPTGEPNSMANSLDMNSNQILNLPDATNNQEPATYSQVLALNGRYSFGNFAISGQDTIEADEREDTLNIEGINGISVTTNASTDTLYIGTAFDDFESGLGTWDNTIEYNTHDLSRGPTDNIIYRSLVDSNIGNNPESDDGTNWRLAADTLSAHTPADLRSSMTSGKYRLGDIVLCTWSGLWGEIKSGSSDNTPGGSGSGTQISNGSLYWQAYLDDGAEVYFGVFKDPADGIIGDGGDDTAAIQACINAHKRPVGRSGEDYRITSGLTITDIGTIVDLKKSRITADFSNGVAVTIGDGGVKWNLGLINGEIYTSNTSSALNGVLFDVNTRRGIQYQGLRTTKFKGYGCKMAGLNWSLQEIFTPLIESCGVGLILDENVNALTVTPSIASCSIGMELRGCTSVTIAGGYTNVCNKGLRLVDSDGGVRCSKITVNGGYASEFCDVDIEADRVRSLTIRDSFLKRNLTGGVNHSIILTSVTGATIEGNYPLDNSVVARNFIQLDSACTQIQIGKNHAQLPADWTVGGDLSGVVEAYGTELTASLPTPSTLNLGAHVLYKGAAAFARPYMCMTAEAGSRRFLQLGLADRYNTATAGATVLPDITDYNVYDLTIAENTTISAPVGSYQNGENIVFLLTQNSVGGYSVSFDSVYETDYSDAGNTASTFASVEFRWSSIRSKWLQSGGFKPWA